MIFTVLRGLRSAILCLPSKVKLTITVKSNSRTESVTKQADGSYRVAVGAPPQGGRANERLIELLAQFFKIPKSQVTIVHGQSGRKKLVEL